MKQSQSSRYNGARDSNVIPFPAPYQLGPPQTWVQLADEYLDSRSSRGPYFTPMPEDLTEGMTQ